MLQVGGGSGLPHGVKVGELVAMTARLYKRAAPVAQTIDRAGLAALVAGEAEAKSAMPPAELRTTLGYPDYDAQAKPFIVKG